MTARVPVRLHNVNAPRDLWLIARTPAYRPYPCMCWGARACGSRCRCRGRTDLDLLPGNCCARLAADVAAPVAEMTEEQESR